jgi:hypothetical protein
MENVYSQLMKTYMFSFVDHSYTICHVGMKVQLLVAILTTILVVNNEVVKVLLLRCNNSHCFFRQLHNVGFEIV